MTKGEHWKLIVSQERRRAELFLADAGVAPARFNDIADCRDTDVSAAVVMATRIWQVTRALDDGSIDSTDAVALEFMYLLGRYETVFDLFHLAPDMPSEAAAGHVGEQMYERFSNAVTREVWSERDRRILARLNGRSGGDASAKVRQSKRDLDLERAADAFRELSDGSMRDPTLKEIAAKTGISLSKLEEMRKKRIRAAAYPDLRKSKR